MINGRVSEYVHWFLSTDQSLIIGLFFIFKIKFDVYSLNSFTELFVQSIYCIICGYIRRLCNLDSSGLIFQFE